MNEKIRSPVPGIFSAPNYLSNSAMHLFINSKKQKNGLQKKKNLREKKKRFLQKRTQNPFLS